MEPFQDAMKLLDLMDRPAFAVRHGVVVHRNAAAASYLVPQEGNAAELLLTGKDEYAAFSQGCLYLTLSLSGREVSASVTKMKDWDVFVLDPSLDRPELRGMALAAQAMREPLSNVMLLADRLLPTMDENDQTARINRGLFQLLRIVGNMSDAARYTTEPGINLEVRDIAAVLEEIFSHAAALLENTPVTLRFTNLAQPVYSQVNGELLERAIYNLLSNALKFSKAGSEIQAAATKKGHKLYLTIRDNGTGVPEALRGSLHARYYREPGLEDGRYGIGLGLLLVRTAAAAHGGTILLEHPAEGGTKITMTMELRQGTECRLRSPIFRIDYAGERDHGLVELSDVLPPQLYEPKKIN